MAGQMTGGEFPAPGVVRRERDVGIAPGRERHRIQIRINAARLIDDRAVRNRNEYRDVADGSHVEKSRPRGAVTGPAAMKTKLPDVVQQLFSVMRQVGVIDEIEKHLEPLSAPVGEKAAAIERVSDPLPGLPADTRIEIDHPVDRHGAQAQFTGDLPEIDIETPDSAFHCHHLRHPFRKISAKCEESISRLSSSTRLKRLPSFGVLR